MSKWFDVKKEDIDITEEGDEMHFWLGSDEDGNVYCSAKINDIKELLAKSPSPRANKVGEK